MASNGNEDKKAPASNYTHVRQDSDFTDIAQCQSHDTDEKSICDSMVNATLEDDGLIDIRSNSIARLLQALPARKASTCDKTSLYESAFDSQNIGNRIPIKAHVVIQVVGSLGDVQPFISIAHALQQSGHHVRLATHSVFKDLVEKHAIEFFDIGGDPAELMAFMVRNPGLLPSSRSALNGEIENQRTVLRGMMERCWRSCLEPRTTPTRSEKIADSSLHKLEPFVADAIIANPPAFAHIHCAERLGIPLHMVFTMPWTPTRAFAHPLARIRSTRGHDDTMNYLSYLVIDMVVWQGLRREINSFRRNTLQLEPLDPVWAPAMLARLGIPTSYCWSPSLVPKPTDWTEEIDVVGFCPSPYKIDEYTPPAELLDFIHRGSTPIYIGFGSIVVDDPEALTLLVLGAVHHAGVRAIVAQGWAKLGTSRANTDQVYFIEDCPHDWLFKHVSCVVHHAGSGTTASGLKAGKPTVTVPFFGDQFFWADKVRAAGAGPAPLPYRQLTVEDLAARISSALASDSCDRVRMLANKLATEDGAEQVRDSFHRSLHFGATRCSLDQNQPAAWRIKRGGRDVHLSSLAAAILVEHRLIDPRCLSRVRSVAYNIDQGPMEPVSGAATAIYGLFYGFSKGVVESVTSLDAVIAHSSESGRSGKLTAKIYSSVVRDRSPTAKVKRARNTDVPTTRKVPIATGCGNAALAIVRSPMTFTLALAKGAHNAPLLWGDTTVREVPRVAGVRSGVLIGCKEMALGVYDGITGLVRLPVVGARENGIIGAISGVGKGLASAPMKLFSAAAAPVGYPLKGVDVRASKIFARRGGDMVERAMLERGEYELLHATSSQQQAVLKHWDELAYE